jgi:hypothetical protein
MKRRRVLVAGIVALVTLGSLVMATRSDHHGPVSALREPLFSSARATVLYADSVLGPFKATQAVRVTVTASATFDPGSGNYTYSYTVKNEVSSQNLLESFSLTPVPVPVSFGTPLHWTGGYGYQGNPNAMGWEVTDNDTGPLPPGDTGDVYPSAFNPSPGQTVTGFTLVTPLAPDMVSFYAQGFDTLLAGGENLGDEDPQPTTYQEGVHGTITGPLLQGVGVPDDRQPSGRVKFRQPLPNPAGGLVSIAFYLPSESKISLAIHDVRGRRIRLLAEGSRPTGVHSVSWNGLDASDHRVKPGVYFFRLLVNGTPIGERRVVILR